MSSQSSIIIPSHFAPGTTDNFITNEIIAKNITAAQVWQHLADISQWSSYYKNCAHITAPDEGPQLEKNRVFKFSTFGFPPLTCTVVESVAPHWQQEGRLAWECRTPEGLRVYHAWLVQDLDGARVRVLTQESQIGPIFAEWSMQKPNKMLLGHQDWLDGLVSKIRGEQIGETNLEKIGFPVRQLDEEEVKKPA